MANAEKQRIASLKDELERAEEKQQAEIAKLREIDSRRQWLQSELEALQERMTSPVKIFMDPTEMAGYISRRDAIMEMLNCAPFELECAQSRINKAANDVNNVRRRLREEELQPKEWKHMEFLEA